MVRTYRVVSAISRFRREERRYGEASIFFGYEWQAPLVMILLLFFTLGVAIGVLSCLGKIFRQRREIAAYRRVNSTNEDHESANNLGDRLK